MTHDEVRTPAQLADIAAEAIRSANHATFPGAGGLTWPSDAYDVLASLSLLASRLPQLLAQLDRFVSREVEAGRVAVDGGEYAGDPQAAAAGTSHWLDQAGVAAHRLADCLDQAQQATAYLAASTDDDHLADDQH
jgi:hypothetical protein